MYKIILVIFIIIFSIYNKSTIEPIVLSCCGGMKNIDPSDPDPPEKIKRCVKEWNTPCTHKGSGDCCKGIDRCIPSHKGGKCKKRDGSGFYTYENGEEIPYDKNRDDTVEYDVLYSDRESKNERSYWTGDNGDIGLWISPNKYLTYFNYFILLLIILTIIYIISSYYIIDESDVSSDYKYQKSYFNYSSPSKYDSNYSDRNYGDRQYGQSYGRQYGRQYGRNH